jgi:hypothetical protein
VTECELVGDGWATINFTNFELMSKRSLAAESIS